MDGTPPRRDPASLDSLLHALRDPHLVLTPDGTVRAASPSARRRLALPDGAPPPAIGELVSDPEDFRAYLRTCSRSGSPLPGAIHLREPAATGADRVPCRGSRMELGTETAVLLRIEGEGGPVGRFPALTRKIEELSAEIHHRKRVEAELREANEVKDAFMATVSHELRTPLNAILGYLDLLREGIPEPLGEAALEHVERIRLGATHLRELIEEILQFSRLREGSAELRWEEVSAVEVAREVRAILEPMARERGLALVIPDPEATLRLETDPGKVRQILLNLLSNAIKYTEEGEVGLTVDGGAGEVVFRVHDTGPGIPEEDRRRIFEPFWRGAAPGSPSQAGTGLGLSISERFASLLGGRIGIESRTGGGSVFELVLPVERPRTGGAATAEAEEG